MTLCGAFGPLRRRREFFYPGCGNILRRKSRNGSVRLEILTFPGRRYESQRILVGLGYQPVSRIARRVTILTHRWLDHIIGLAGAGWRTRTWLYARYTLLHGNEWRGRRSSDAWNVSKIISCRILYVESLGEQLWLHTEFLEIICQVIADMYISLIAHIVELHNVRVIGIHWMFLFLSVR